MIVIEIVEEIENRNGNSLTCIVVVKRMRSPVWYDMYPPKKSNEAKMPI